MINWNYGQNISICTEKNQTQLSEWELLILVINQRNRRRYLCRPYVNPFQDLPWGQKKIALMKNHLKGIVQKFFFRLASSMLSLICIESDDFKRQSLSREKKNFFLIWPQISWRALTLRRAGRQTWRSGQFLNAEALSWIDLEKWRKNIPSQNCISWKGPEKLKFNRFDVRILRKIFGLIILSMIFTSISIWG